MTRRLSRTLFFDAEELRALTGIRRAFLSGHYGIPAEYRPSGANSDMLAGETMILLVENEAASADVYFSVLTLDGYAVSVAPDGFDALKQIEWQLPDLILVSDWKMPGLNGIDLCRIIRNNPVSRAIPIILMGGSWPSFEKDAVFEAFLQKPFQVAALLSMVRKVAGAEHLQSKEQRA